ncbi:hypothetical protein Pan241w_30810 [Gimesia alba]|uniref:Lipoprotein n=1 Tax=Gimesia alba TaxID=2527973 RepID=A0A517RGI4_9PLAN|nr:hypothetical protein [Gimesia alba]QDT42986.1 hypothetical protein Pan241w_30810 [Gimesia alba]
MLNVHGRTTHNQSCINLHCLYVVTKVTLVLLAVILLPACASVRTFLPQQPPVCVLPPNASYTQIVTHLNSQTEGVYGWQSSNVKIRARQKGGIPVSLNAMLAVEQPKRFRLRASSPLGAEVDFGSNDERFWFWVKRNEQKRVFTVRHDQYQAMGSQLNIPFEPGWLLEALRVVPLNETELSIQKEGQNSPNVKLISDRLLPNGKLVQKILVVNLCTGHIIEQSLYDSQGQRIATATLGEYRVCSNSGATLPHVIKLDWPQAGIVLTMTMSNIEVNPAGVPPEVWGLPQIPGYPVLDLGSSFPVQREASIGPRPTRIDSRIAELEEPDWSNSTLSEEPQWKPAQTGFEKSETFPVNELQPLPRDNPFRPPGSFDEPEEAPGRVRL